MTAYPVAPDTPAEHAQTWVFTVAAAVWTIDHMLGRSPVVQTFLDSGGEVQGEVAHPTLNRTTVSFVIPTAGRAHCA